MKSQVWRWVRFPFIVICSDVLTLKSCWTLLNFVYNIWISPSPPKKTRPLEPRFGILDPSLLRSPGTSSLDLPRHSEAVRIATPQKNRTTFSLVGLHPLFDRCGYEILSFPIVKVQTVQFSTFQKTTTHLKNCQKPCAGMVGGPRQGQPTPPPGATPAPNLANLGLGAGIYGSIVGFLVG